MKPTVLISRPSAAAIYCSPWKKPSWAVAEALSHRHDETKSPAESSKDWPSPVCSPLPCSRRMKGPDPLEPAILPRAGVEEHLGGTVGSEHRPNTKVGRCFHFQESAQRAGDFEAEPGRWSGRHHSGPLPTPPDSGFSTGWCFRSNTSKLPSSVLVIKACPFAIP